MILTIDTTHPLNGRDKAILRTLLDGAPPARGVADALHQGTPTVTAPNGGPIPRRLSTAEALAAGVGAVAAAPPQRRPDGSIADARRPVAQQAGVSFTESVAEDIPEETPPAG